MEEQPILILFVFIWCEQALVDPVCFLTCYPQLLYNFVYRVPKISDALGSLAGLVATARFIFSRDLIIAEVSTHPCISNPSTTCAIFMRCGHMLAHRTG